MLPLFCPFSPSRLPVLLALAAIGWCLGAVPALATSDVEAGLKAAATDAELAAAKDDFLTYCSGCHGDDARGRGPIAIELKTKPADLTRISERNGGSFDREAVYRRIEGLDMPLSHGTAEMPIWGAWFVHQAVGEGVLLEDAKTAAKQATQRINNLVKYLETLQK